METIITYDISGKQTEFKDKMKELGYKDKFKGNKCDWICLPNTTLYHSTKNPKEARIDAQNLCKDLKIVLEKCVATIWEDWSAICGN